MDVRSRPVLIWRWAVFALAAGYLAHEVVSSDYSYPFGPFRYLTIWAMVFSTFAASRMLAISQGRSANQWAPLVATTAVLNAMVVYLYWSLFLKDPALVRNGPVNPWTEYYMHLAGPLLQWIDMVFVWRGFRRYRPAAGVLLVVVLAYVGWVELVLHPISDRPAGVVTAGLPYPFLNDMEPAARLRYYATIGAAAMGVLGLFRLAAALVERRR